MEEKEFSFEERVARCALNSIFGFEPRKGKMLIDAAGGAFEVFSTDGNGGIWICDFGRRYPRGGF